MDGRTAKPLRILVAEDDPADVRLTREGLRESGVPYDLRVVSDGQQALDALFQRGAFRGVPLPDIVLLDLNLPRKNGHDVLREIKCNRALRHIPVIVFSSSLSEADVAASYDLSANGFVRKPGDLDEMLRVVKAIVNFWGKTAHLSGSAYQPVAVAAGAMP